MRQFKGTVNQVELIGWLGDAPESLQLAGSSTLARFSIATKRPGARQPDGQYSVETDWLSVEAWDKLAGQAVGSLHKGSRVRVTGSIVINSWEDKATGQRRSRPVVRAESLMFLDARPEQTEAEAEAQAEEVELAF